MSGVVLSVNVGGPRATDHSDVGVTSIDKRPANRPVEITAPATKGIGGSALDGDTISDKRHHGGPDQAVYAYAREDLDSWAAELGRDLRSGMFGENLTTAGVDVTGALIGERWRIGDAVLEVSVPRIPCRTFAGHMAEPTWVKRFTRAAMPGAYLRVIELGSISAGAPIEIVFRPDHAVTIGVTFRALTIEPGLLPALLAADALPEEAKELARRRTPFPVEERLTGAD